MPWLAARCPSADGTASNLCASGGARHHRDILLLPCGGSSEPCSMPLRICAVASATALGECGRNTVEFLHMHACAASSAKT